MGSLASFSHKNYSTDFVINEKGKEYKRKSNNNGLPTWFNDE